MHGNFFTGHIMANDHIIFFIIALHLLVPTSKSVPIITQVVSLNPIHGEVYPIQQKLSKTSWPFELN